MYFLHLSLSSVILIDSSTESPVHVLMLSIQAVRGLPRLRAPGIVPRYQHDYAHLYALHALILLMHIHRRFFV